MPDDCCDDLLKDSCRVHVTHQILGHDLYLILYTHNRKLVDMFW